MRRWERDLRRECQSLAEQAKVTFAIKVGPHLRITLTGPAGARKITTSGTPSDIRTIRNFRRDFARIAALVAPPPRATAPPGEEKARHVFEHVPSQATANHNVGTKNGNEIDPL
jgi:hypothetical protein